MAYYQQRQQHYERRAEPLEEKIAVNGVELVNRHELSSTQDRELQRFIDNNAHILQWKEKEPLLQRLKKKPATHEYDKFRRSLSRGPSPFDEHYNSLSKFSQKEQVKVDELPPIEPNQLPITPNIEEHNYTEEFPGLEYLSDNQFIEQLIKQGQLKIGSSGLISNPNSRTNSAMGNYPDSYAYSNISRGNSMTPSQHYSEAYYGTHGSNSNMSQYGTARGGIKNPHLPPTSPYSSLKRKGVSWLDQERARSLSPAHQKQQHQYARPASTVNGHY